MLSIVKGLEILQNTRGRLLNLVFDAHKSHVALSRENNNDQRPELFKLIKGNTSLLAATGISLVIGSAKRHEKVSSAERIVAKVKRILLTTIKSYVFKDHFDINHKMSLIQLFLNERPLFFASNRVFSPNSIDIALLRRSGSNIKVFNLADYFVPTDRDTQRLLYQLSEDSKQILHLVSNDILKLLNRKILGEQFKLKKGALVYVCDLLQAKNPHSLIHSLARITHVSKGGTNYQLRLSNNSIITRHLYSLIPTQVNANYFLTNTIDILCLPTAEDVITPSMTRSKFDAYMDSFNVQKNKSLHTDTDKHLPVTADVEQTSRLDFSRAADIRRDVSPRAVPRVVIPHVIRHNQNIIPRMPSVPAIEYLPSPEEEEIRMLQQEVDESITVRPKEFGHNLSLPRVKHNKTKTKNRKQQKQQKKQSPKKKEESKTDYQPTKY